MTQAAGRYLLVITPTARRQLADRLPEAAALAAYEFIVGPLLDSPQRIVRRLRPPLADRHSARRGTYRVIYRIDDTQRTVTVWTLHIVVRPIAATTDGWRRRKLPGPARVRRRVQVRNRRPVSDR